MAENESTDLVVIDPYSLADIGKEEDKVLNEKINRAIKDILAWDNRLSADTETVLALKDYIQAEIVQMKVFKRILDGDDESNTERLFRSCLNAKNILRDEIWGNVGGQKPKEEEVNKVKEILIEHKVIEAEPIIPKENEYGTGPDKRKSAKTGNKE
jgi:hypothetical protein